MRTLLKIIFYIFGVPLIVIGVFNVLASDASWFGALLILFGAIFVLIGRKVGHQTEKQWAAQVQKEEQRRLASVAVEAQIIGTGTKANAGSAIGRAVVGDFIAGDVGAIVGAATAKSDGTTKFLVTYADGHTAVETVKDNSARFKTLIAYIK